MERLIVFFEIVFGIVVFVRISDSLRTKKLISDLVMTKFVAAYGLWVLLWAACPRISSNYFSFCLWLPIGVLYFSPKLFKHLRKKQFRRDFSELLNQIILKMQSGRSFRSSLQAASQNFSEFSRYKFEKMFENLSFGNPSPKNSQSDPDVESLLMHFRQAEADSHRVLPRLQQLREKIKVADSLQKKINQSLQQHYAQIGVLTALYSGLLAYTLSKFGWYPQSRLITTSILLYILGFFFSLRVGRRFKWKV